MTGSHALSHGAVIAALAVAVAGALFLGRRIGDLLPMAAMLATGALMIFVVSEIPGSPTYCLHTKDSCQHGLTGMTLCVFIVPLGVACVIKALRGDKRGTTRTWTFFRRRRSR